MEKERSWMLTKLRTLRLIVIVRAKNTASSLFCIASNIPAKLWITSSFQLTNRKVWRRRRRRRRTGDVPREGKEEYNQGS